MHVFETFNKSIIFMLPNENYFHYIYKLILAVYFSVTICILSIFNSKLSVHTILFSLEFTSSLVSSKMTLKISLKFTIILALASHSSSWTLSPLGMTLNSTSIIHVSVYYNRAFLCLEHQNFTNLPTFVEATWPENLIGVKPKIFPNESEFKKRTGKCRGIQQAKCTDIDEKGRLWMIDEGNEKCAPKIFVYDLLYFNEEVSFRKKFF